MTNASRAAGTTLFDEWTAYWNEAYDLADVILAPTFVLHYAQAGGEHFDDIHTPEEMTAMVQAWHTMRKNILFAAEGECVVDLVDDGHGLSGRVARPYLVEFDGEDGARVSRSGVDILKVTHGRIVEVWSVSSGAQGRTFYA